MIKTFREYLEEGKAHKVNPNRARAASLLRQADARLRDLERLPIDDESAPFRFESAYEALRETTQALLEADGYTPKSHEAIIAYIGEKRILAQDITYRLDMMRIKRNDINYRAEIVTAKEAKQAIAFAKRTCKLLGARLTIG